MGSRRGGGGLHIDTYRGGGIGGEQKGLHIDT